MLEDYIPGYLNIDVGRFAAENDGTLEAVATAANLLRRAALFLESKNTDRVASKTNSA